MNELERAVIFVWALASLVACTSGQPPAPPDAGPRCEPGQYLCDGTTLVQCSLDGLELDHVETCDVAAGAVCTAGLPSCQRPCELAEATDSYVGCEYWPVTTLSNLAQPDTPIALAAANVSAWPAELTLTRGERVVSRTTIAPFDVGVIELPSVEALAQRGRHAPFSVLTRGGAYRLRSTMPITAYQFNPFAGVGAGGVRTGTADASLLFPAHVLGDDYLVLGWRGEVAQAEQLVPLPAFVNVVAVEDASVRIVAPTEISSSLDGVVRDSAPHEEQTFELRAGDVVQVLGFVPTECEIAAHQGAIGFCDLGARGDLSGTRIRSTGRIQVISGAGCAMVPFDRVACDHLEETVPPLVAWGRETVVAVARNHESHDMMVRVISAGDGNEIRFTPAVHPTVVLDEGEVLELSTTVGFHVSAQHPILVGQFLTGQGLATDPRLASDPAMAFAPPVEQFRTQYRFLAPASYDANYVTVTGPAGVAASLDGEVIRSFTALGDSGYVSARVRVEAGPHELVSSQPTSLMGFGFNGYTSYLYPGGLDVRPILE